MRGTPTKVAVPALGQHPPHREEVQHCPWGMQTAAKPNLVLMPSNIQKTDTLAAA